ncbi:unnamed protein product [Cuscuta campestris]|uniref:Phytocyanin domain-containing protein n=1 Tax=Cuscuta campestris TaxID=132261 RepID=A0A484M9M9_9ASTE|nr:unnamed protein product [Cuscuta campestris]
MALLIASVLLSGKVVVPTLGKTYTVGDSTGWGLGGDYATWASDKTFKVGDSLVFNYQGGGHTVDEVSESDYKSCAAANSISSDSSGATTVQLKTAGKHFFICSSTGHCGQGMKLEVNVVRDSGSSSSSSATTPSSPAASSATPAASGAPPDPPSTTTPSKKLPSSSSAVAVSLPLAPLLLAAMNLVAVMI